jgi:hypothetical protein
MLADRQFVNMASKSSVISEASSGGLIGKQLICLRDLTSKLKLFSLEHELLYA